MQQQHVHIVAVDVLTRLALVSCAVDGLTRLALVSCGEITAGSRSLGRSGRLEALITETLTGTSGQWPMCSQRALRLFALLEGLLTFNDDAGTHIDALDRQVH